VPAGSHSPLARGPPEGRTEDSLRACVHDVEAAWVEVVPDRARGLAVPPRSRARGPPEGRTEDSLRVCVHDVETAWVKVAPYCARGLATRPLELGNARRSP